MRSGGCIDAATIKLLGLADMVGSSAELATEAQRLRQILDKRGATASIAAQTGMLFGVCAVVLGVGAEQLVELFTEVSGSV